MNCFVNNHLSLAAAATSFWGDGFIILHCFKATWQKDQWISIRENKNIDKDLSRQRIALPTIWTTAWGQISMFSVRTYIHYASNSVFYTEYTNSFDWHGTTNIVTKKMHAVNSLPNTRRHPSSKSDPSPLHFGLMLKWEVPCVFHVTKVMPEQKIC